MKILEIYIIAFTSFVFMSGMGLLLIPFKLKLNLTKGRNVEENHLVNIKKFYIVLIYIFFVISFVIKYKIFLSILFLKQKILMVMFMFFMESFLIFTLIKFIKKILSLSDKLLLQYDCKNVKIIELEKYEKNCMFVIVFLLTMLTFTLSFV